MTEPKPTYTVDEIKSLKAALLVKDARYQQLEAACRRLIDRSMMTSAIDAFVRKDDLIFISDLISK